MSEPQSQSRRLTALDGLRGLSSLLVLLSHLRLDSPIFISKIQFLPLQNAIQTILNMGIISVGYFFILCGFLMVLLYENPGSYIRFVQKRYFRIFSVFIVALIISFGVVTLQMRGTVSVLMLMFFAPIILRIVYGVLSVLAKQRFLLIFFLIIFVAQVVFAFLNYFIVFRIEPQEFYSLPKVVYTSFIFMTNVTLTFIFGDYIPMLDGGYWSLVTEVMFYLTYPMIAWFIVKPIKNLSQRYWVLWYFASMVSFYGLRMLFKNLLGFETAHIHFAHYFTVGMMIALAYKERNTFFHILLRFFETRYGQVVSVLCYLIPLCLAYWIGIKYDSFKNILIAYASAPLMGTAVISIIAQKNILSRLFSAKPLVFLGSISYPLYVVHFPITELFWNILSPDKHIHVWWIYTALVVTTSLLCAYFISRIVESLYFKISSRVVQTTYLNIRKNLPSPKRVFILLTICVIIVVFIAFQKDFSIFTLVRSHTSDTLKISNTLQENGILRGEFTVDEDRLGIIVMNVVHVGSQKLTQITQTDNTSNTLIFRIRQKGSQEWYHESQHTGWKISSKEPYPFGFPEIQSSTNKWYEFELQSVNASPTDYVTFPDIKESFRSVYRLSKTSIIRKPTLLLSVVSSKIYRAFSQSEAQYVVLLYLFTAWFVWFIHKKAKNIQNV